MYPLGSEPSHPVQQGPHCDAALGREQEAADEGSLNDFTHLRKGRPEGGAFVEEGEHRRLQFFSFVRPIAHSGRPRVR
jgi:hypothetical protein